jgi:SAM-dependent methyltransferase
MFVSDEKLDAVRNALLADDSNDLIEAIFRLNLRRPLNDVPEASVTKAIDLGWVDADGHTLTELGQLVADPIREYRFWLERGRTLHVEAIYPLLAARTYEGKRVLEPGSGFGANLFSLGLAGAECVGIEPTRLYRQFTSIFAEREGLPVPKVLEGAAEALPFGDDEFDYVLVYTAHQYMDIRIAIAEMARVLRPGGQLRIMGTVFGTYASGVFKEIFLHRKWRSAKGVSLTIVNTLGYQLVGKRLYVPRGRFSTSAPIYPSYASMSRYMKEAGLEPRHDLARRVSMGTAMFADRV